MLVPMLVTIMRGVPGSGKTWWHEHKYRENDRGRIVVCSANDHFTDPKTKEYHFRAEELHKAHGYCLQKFVQELVDAQTAAHVIVDNTNIHAVEMAPYIALAEAYRVPYEIVRVQPRGMDAVALARRCVHDVPAEKVGRMLYNMKNNGLPRFWNRETVIE